MSRSRLRGRGTLAGRVSLIVCLCLALGVAGCAGRASRHGMPFDLDKVFDNRFVSPQEDWKEKGVRLAKDKQFTQAIDAFTRYVEEDPDNFFGFNAIAVCFKNLGDHGNAMKNYERALEFTGSPEERAKVLANIGNLYSSANKPQVALGYYKEAAGEFEKNPLYLIFIARTFVDLNDVDRARKVLASAELVHKDLEKYERDEDKGLGSYLMAYCYAALNEEDKVFYHLENALKANPERYVSRIEQDLSDMTSLLYTLKEDDRVRKMLNRYRSKVGTAWETQSHAFFTRLIPVEPGVSNEGADVRCCVFSNTYFLNCRILWTTPAMMIIIA
ncbi:MAG TPA: tetratricopeptide repeat protein [Desulfomonilaceae bacterium]|nr:tetratricopeptide repeat protein [Desulfomonilaceae bacterium]